MREAMYVLLVVISFTCLGPLWGSEEIKVLLPPVISNVQVAEVTSEGVIITWDTNEPADSLVIFDTVTPPSASSQYDAAMVTSHMVEITGEPDCTHYYFFVRSTDQDMETSTDNNGGAYYEFTTLLNGIFNYVSSDTPLSIPDTNPGQVESVITISDYKRVTDVNVEVNITHTWVGDLSLRLITPVGSTISLSDKNGSSGDNYTNTLFDDEASSPIGSGSPPFTGSFIPESPLSEADDLNAYGDWKLQVYDQSSPDSGTIDEWTLILTLDTYCGPHALFVRHTLLQDSCSLGGPGFGDGIWDAGELIQFSVDLYHDGTDPVSNVSATVTPLTAGVTMMSNTADFNAMSPGDWQTSLPGHFLVDLAPTIPCGTMVSFQLDVSTTEGSWEFFFDQLIGQNVTNPFELLSEDFESWGPFGNNPPAGWTIFDFGDESSPVWNENDWHRFDKGGAYGYIARVNFIPFETSDEWLITPAFDIPADAVNVNLEFDHFYNDDSSTDYAYVDYTSDQNPGWNTIITYNADTSDMEHETLSLLAFTGDTNAQVRFRYIGDYDWHWHLDNVLIAGESAGSCQMNLCSTAPDEVSSPAAIYPLYVEKDSVNCPGTGYCLYFEKESVSSGYNLYEGTIGIWFSHDTAPGNVCDTVFSDLGTGEMRLELNPSGSDHYYLVTGFNSLGEGTAGSAARDTPLSCPP